MKKVNRNPVQQVPIWSFKWGSLSLSLPFIIGIGIFYHYYESIPQGNQR